MPTREFLYAYLAPHRLGVLATNGTTQSPNAAVVGIAVTPQLEIVFDTLATSRKYANLMADARAAFVIGWDDITTVQYEGRARLLAGPEDDHYREVYYAAYPDGRDRARDWAGLVHFVVTPTWVRYSSFGEVTVIEELLF